ncbi:MAG: hypothetical protein KF832_17290 [Caldilineaceae bacterium]|nr:hypothetical protein [Caldilineaceae bacterium]
MVDQAQSWQRCGQWSGGTVVSLALAPDFAETGVILAATAAGLYRTADGGRQWVGYQQAFADPRVTAVTFAATHKGTIAFAATADARLFGSSDQGLTWQEAPAWAGLGLINVITPSPAYAADQTLFVATPEGIFRSQDGGNRWESSTFGLLDLEVLCLACAPTFTESELLWAGSALGGLYRSRNGARSWRDAGQGLPDMAFQCLAVSPNFAQDQTLYVGTESDGLYISTDGGNHWQPVPSPVAGQSINALAFSPQGQTLWVGAGAGIYAVTDGGQHWRLTTEAPLAALTLAVTPDQTLLAGTYQAGLFSLAAGAESWQPALDLAAHAPPLALRDRHNTFYCLDIEGALAQSNDEGRTWQLLNAAFAQEPIGAVAMGSHQTSAWLAVATTTTLAIKALSSELAPDWQTYPLPAAAATPTWLTCAPRLATVPALFFADANGSLYLLTPEEGDWQPLVVPWVGSQLLQLACTPTYAFDQTLYALTTQAAAAQPYLVQLWQSTDHGLTWQAIADFYAETPTAVMTLPHDPVEEPIWVGVGNRLIKIYRQADRTWAVDQQFLAPTTRIIGLATTDTYLESHLLYLTTNQGVLQSADGGASCTAVSDELTQQPVVAFFPSSDEMPAYAVALGGVLWRQG